MTNKEFSKTNSQFKEACGLAGIDPTTRHASKWRRKTGKAFKLVNGIK